ncbi:MAG TPA: methyltransferase domain-containing protein [Gemmatimonadaceae bacterium]|nr:methyltransferase domain-containing protein [Gemmatimonadaceae bacterium]
MSGGAPCGPGPRLPAREAYRLWAATYEAETAVSLLDEQVVAELGPPVAGRRLLDAGCGTGRRLRAAAGATRRAGADLTWEMLRAGAGSGVEAGEAPADASASRRAEPASRPRGAAALAAADVRALPFATGAFDLVWCRLVVGHLADLGAAYAELARVCAPAGDVVVTDFHPDAARAGHARTFRDAAGRVRAVEHHVHPPAAHLRAAAASGLEPIEWRDGVVGPAVRALYERAGRLDAYDAQLGLPLVLAVSFRRRAPAAGCA